MPRSTLLRLDGEVERPLALTFADLASLAEEFQVADVGQLDSQSSGKKRRTAVWLEGLLTMAGAKPSALYLGLHASHDDFHASVPLAAVRQRGLLIYAVDQQPLSVAEGGPARFWIVDHAACRAEDVDECANVKFVDHMELQRERGHDNRPTDDAAHAALHEREGNPPG